MRLLQLDSLYDFGLSDHAVVHMRQKGGPNQPVALMIVYLSSYPP